MNIKDKIREHLAADPEFHKLIPDFSGYENTPDPQIVNHFSTHYDFYANHPNWRVREKMVLHPDTGSTELNKFADDPSVHVRRQAASTANYLHHHERTREKKNDLAWVLNKFGNDPDMDVREFAGYD